MRQESPTVFVVDDDSSVLSSTKRILETEGFTVRTFDSPERLFAHGRPNGPCCLVLDVHLDGQDGIEYYETLVRSGMPIPAIFITAFGDVPMSVRAMKLGAVESVVLGRNEAPMIQFHRQVLAAIAGTTSD